MTTSIAHPPSPPAAGTAGASVPTPKRASRAPLDPRLVREVRAARAHVLRTTMLGLVQAACVITTALVIGHLGAELLVERQLPQPVRQPTPAQLPRTLGRQPPADRQPFEVQAVRTRQVADAGVVQVVQDQPAQAVGQRGTREPCE